MKRRGIGLAAALALAVLPDVVTSQPRPALAADAPPAGWDATVPVSPTGVNASGGRLVVDIVGNATAVWVGPGGVLAARRARTAAAWSAPTVLGSVGAFGAQAQLAVDANGDVLAAWDGGAAGGGHAVRAAWFRAATGTWGASTDVSAADATSMFVVSPAVAVDAQGNGVVVWNRSDGSMWWATSTVGGTWTPLGQLTGLGPMSEVALAPDHTGTFTAIWSSRRTPVNETIHEIRAARFDLTERQWRQPTLLSSSTAVAINWSGHPRLAVDGDDNVTAVWARVSASTNVQSARFEPSTGAWTTPVDLTPSGVDARLGVDAAGNVTAVWVQYVQAGFVVRGTRFDRSTGTWSEPVSLSTLGPSIDLGAQNPDVVVDRAGNATAIWTRQASPSVIEEVATFDATSATWSAAAPLSTTPTGSPNYGPPQLGIDVAGDVTAMWWRYDGAVSLLQSARRIAPPVGFHAVTPMRVFDTRAGESPDAGLAVAKAKVGDDGLVVPIVDLLGAPARGTVGAVALNVTVTNPDAAGFVTVWPCGDRPLVSSLNYTAGQTVANAVIAPVSNDGTICFSSKVSTDLVVDLDGWLPVAGGFTAVEPVRVFDTRPGESPDAVRSVPAGKVRLQPPLEVAFTDVAGIVPARGVSAVSVNVTVTGPEGAGFLTVWPCGDRPLVSSLNYADGQTAANAVVVPVSASGTVCFASKVPTDVVVDLNGWFDATGGFTAVAPSRVFDTRPGESPTAILPSTGSAVVTDPPLRAHLTGLGGLVPTAGVRAVSLNVTVTGSTAAGFVTVYPCGEFPGVSNVNHAAGQTVANAVIVPVGADGSVCFASKVPADLVVDINGWFAG